MAVVAEKIIRIDVVTAANAQRSINALASDMRKIETSTASMKRELNTGFSSLNLTFGKFASFLGAFGIATGLGALTRAVLDSASAYQVLESRLSLVLGSSEKARSATAEIADIAKVTGREIDGVAKLYEKASRSAQQFGISQGQVSQITLGFAQSIRLSGASTQEAYASLVQFGQALASGRLQGDEFRSLMENNAVFMYEFARAAGISVSELRKMGTEGKLNAKFLFETMAKEGEDGLNMMQRLNKMAAEVPLTFSQSLTSMGSALFEFVGETSKLLSFSTGDKKGLFGPLIDGITNLTNRIKDLKIETDALDDGFFAKLYKLYNAIPRPGELLFGGSLFKRNDKTLTQTLTDEMESARKALMSGHEKLNKVLEQQRRNPNLTGIEKIVLDERIEDAAKNVRKLEEAYAKLSIAQRGVQYGERHTETTNKPVVIPDAAAEKRLKAAAEALKDFVEQKEREAEANRRLLAGEAETRRSAADLLSLEAKLKEAHAGTNSEMAKRGRLAIKQAEDFKLQLEARLELEKIETKRAEAETEAIENVRKQIERDDASIDALVNKSRATDEYTASVLRREKAERVLEALSIESTGGAGGDQQTRRLYELIALYDVAIDKKAELIDARAASRQQSEQERIDNKNQRALESEAEQINTALKRSLTSGEGGKSIAEQFIDNLKDTLRGKAVDIVVNPVTTIMSRVLAELADDFSKRLTKSLYESIASSSSDPIGSLIGLLSFGSGSSSDPDAGGGKGLRIPLASGIPFVPFDNFPASLHKGERVLTKQENKDYANGPRQLILNSSPVFNIDSRADAAQVAQIAAEVSAESNRQLVESLRAQGAI
jgi:tape measure domain-containing protein